MKSKTMYIILLIFASALIIGCEAENTSSSNYNSETSYEASTSNEPENIFDQLTFSSTNIKADSIGNTLYVKVTNNSSKTVQGSIKGFIHKDGRVVDHAVLHLPSEGLSSGSSATINGSFSDDSNSYDYVEYQPSTFRVK